MAINKNTLENMLIDKIRKFTQMIKMRKPHSSQLFHEYFNCFPLAPVLFVDKHLAQGVLWTGQGPQERPTEATFGV